MFLALVTDVVAEGKQCLVFCPTRARCENATAVIVRDLVLPLSDDLLKSQSALLDVLQMEEYGYFAGPIQTVFRQMILQGVAFQHAGKMHNKVCFIMLYDTGLHLSLVMVPSLYYKLKPSGRSHSTTTRADRRRLHAEGAECPDVHLYARCRSQPSHPEGEVCFLTLKLDHGTIVHVRSICVDMYVTNRFSGTLRKGHYPVSYHGISAVDRY